MITVAVMYPAGDAFDLSYYMQTHIPLVKRLWEGMGLQNIQVLRGMPGPDGTGPVYSHLALLTFQSMDSFKAAAGQHGGEIFADIPNFTQAKPNIQFSETVA